jgi:phospholipid/cholesterol/gamma-HCH transport system substrate-binding protein
VLAKVDKLLGSGEAEGVLADASETLRSVKAMADNLNARIGPIADGLTRFSGQGLRDVQALVNESRASIVRIQQSISDLERNPQRILTGGEGAVRQYDGRARR